MANICNRDQLEILEPQSWSEFVGNRRLKEYCRDLIHGVRIRGLTTGFNAIIAGHSRTGKTATIAYAMKCMGCHNLDMNTLEACGKCDICRSLNHKLGNRNWENWCDYIPEEGAPKPIQYHFTPVDCTTLTTEGLDQICRDIRWNVPAVSVIYLDEVHRLCSRNMDEKLLIPMEKYPAIWIASSSYADRTDGSNRRSLEKMFLNRFNYRLTTEKPGMPEMVEWLTQMCERLAITVEDPRSTLTELTRRCDRVPGMALQLLVKARNTRDKLLTRKLMDEHVFDFDEGCAGDGK